MNKETITKFVEEVTEAFEKAIGTSSSINEERDERSVENYVRTGGNTMENTTEPDPKGDIAINKDLPNVSRPDAVVTIDQEVRPTDDVTTSAAPNNDALADVSTGGAGVYKGVGGKCESCGQAMPVEKSASDDEVTETVEKAADVESKEEDATETAADEKKEEVKKSVTSSIWNGAFSPLK